MPWSVITFGVVAACTERMSGSCAPSRIKSMVNHWLSGAWLGRTFRELFLSKARRRRLWLVPAIQSISFVMSMFLRFGLHAYVLATCEQRSAQPDADPRPRTRCRDFKCLRPYMPLHVVSSIKMVPGSVQFEGP